MKSSVPFVRVLGGSMKGKKIFIPSAIYGHQNVTTQKMKESIFNILLNFFPTSQEVVFCDLFSGSGQIGIEALSRDFNHVIFCERDTLRLVRLKQWLKKNIQCDNFSLLKRYGERALKQVLSSQTTFIEESKKMEKSILENLVIFIDPPYSHGLFEKINLIIDSLHKTKIENSCYKNFLYLFQIPARMKIQKIEEKFEGRYRYGNNQILSRYF